MGDYSIEKLGRNKTCAPQFSPQFDRGCFKWATCATRIYIKWLGTRDTGDLDEHFRLRIRYYSILLGGNILNIRYLQLRPPTYCTFFRPSQTLRSFKGHGNKQD